MGEFERVVDSAAFDEAIGGGDLMIAKFQTKTCVVCRRLEPGLRQLRDRTDGALRIIEVDADEIAVLTERYDIRGVPTLILFKDGNEITRRNGFQSSNMLREWIAPHVGS